MHSDRISIRQLLFLLIAISMLAGSFLWRASANYSHIDYRRANFVFFWLAGRMVVGGENPYESSQWIAAHDTNDVSWRPNLIFPYPLPLAFFLAPLGLVDLGTAYVGWQLLSEVVIAASIYYLLRVEADTLPGTRLTKTILISLLILSFLFFGPVFLTLQIGALGAWTLAGVTAALAALQRQRSLLAGMLLALTLLKPPQGAPIVMLVFAWLVARRDLKGIAGLALGSAGLLTIGMLGDPAWPLKFANAGQAVMDRTMGVQSNVLSLAYLACGRQTACMWQLGGGIALAILGLTATYLAIYHLQLTPWEMLSISIPVGFVATAYLWSYDQILYVVPTLLILRRLTEKSGTFRIAAIFQTLLVTVSFAALVIQARTHSDLASFFTTLLVLGGLVAVLRPRTMVALKGLT